MFKHRHMHGVLTHAPKAFLALTGLLLTSLCAAQTAIPGVLQAESYASMAGVQLETTTDSGGGQDVGWIDTGDWMSYSVNPSKEGWYKVEYRIASTGTTGIVVLSQNAADITANTAIPNTGGWQTWQTVASRVYLKAGTQTLAVYAKGGGFNLNWVNFTAEATSSSSSSSSSVVSIPALPAIKQSGQYWVNASGARVNLRGTNIGNWLIMEYWMLNQSMYANGTQIGDQCKLESTLSQRFGTAEKERLMKVYRDSWITTRDFDLMKSMGMNVIRIPFLYSLVEDEYHPYTLRADAWQYLDFAVNEAEKRGMYVILDLHGAVGGQAAADQQHDGCVGPADMWTNTTYRDRTKWLWDMIASHYRGRTAIAAYDTLNEPWGTDATTLANFAYELFTVIRAKDPEHVILLPGHNSGIDAYGNPNSRGLTNSAFWMHFYPGLWGWNDTATPGAGQANMYANWLHCTNGSDESCAWKNKIDGLQTPFLIGEFQPWTLLGSYGGQMTRKAYDIFNQYGWAATNWAYKIVSNGGSNGDTSSWGWGMVTNSNSASGTFSNIDVGSATNAQIEAYFRRFATQALIRNESIAYWMNWQPSVGNQIEAEMFNNHSGMRMETTSDTGGGFNVAYIDNGDWMSYSINIPTSGSYQLQVRISSPNTTGQLVLSKNAVDITTIAVPNTGGWQNWQTVSTTVNLTAGQQDLAWFARVGGYNINWWKLTKL